MSNKLPPRCFAPRSTSERSLFALQLTESSSRRLRESTGESSRRRVTAELTCPRCSGMLQNKITIGHQVNNHHFMSVQAFMELDGVKMTSLCCDTCGFTTLRQNKQFTFQKRPTKEVAHAQQSLARADPKERQEDPRPQEEGDQEQAH